MTDGRFKINAAVYLLLMKGDKILLLRRFNTGWSDGMYSLPAGHIDGNEPLTAAACREALEETGIILLTKDITFAHAMHRINKEGDGKEYIDFFFAATKWQGTPYNAEPQKCDDLDWFPIGHIPENTISYVKQIIQNHQKGLNFSEIGW